MAENTFGADYTVGVNQVNYFHLNSRPLSEQVADLEKQLADLKAKQAAEAAEKAKTYGQRVAEDLVRLRNDGSIAIARQALVTPYSDRSFPDMQKDIAAALDKAHADGKAEQREADAALVYRHYVQLSDLGFVYDQALTGLIKNNK
jgi:hypothetical protein